MWIMLTRYTNSSNSIYRLIHKKTHWSKNTLLIKYPQFHSDLAGILIILPTHELIILTKFDEDKTKIVIFLQGDTSKMGQTLRLTPCFNTVPTQPCFQITVLNNAVVCCTV